MRTQSVGGFTAIIIPRPLSMTEPGPFMHLRRLTFGGTLKDEQRREEVRMCEKLLQANHARNPCQSYSRRGGRIKRSRTRRLRTAGSGDRVRRALGNRRGSGGAGVAHMDDWGGDGGVGDSPPRRLAGGGHHRGLVVVGRRRGVVAHRRMSRMSGRRLRRLRRCRSESKPRRRVGRPPGPVRRVGRHGQATLCGPEMKMLRSLLGDVPVGGGRTLGDRDRIGATRRFLCNSPLWLNLSLLTANGDLTHSTGSTPPPVCGWTPRRPAETGAGCTTHRPPPNQEPWRRLLRGNSSSRPRPVGAAAPASIRSVIPAASLLTSERFRRPHRFPTAAPSAFQSRPRPPKPSLAGL